MRIRLSSDYLALEWEEIKIMHAGHSKETSEWENGKRVRHRVKYYCFAILCKFPSDLICFALAFSNSGAIRD